MTQPRRQRPKAFRLLCSEATVNAVEAALPSQVGATGRMIRKTELVDVIVSVALNHPEEITAALNATEPEGGPDDR